MPLRAKKMCGAAGVNNSSHVSGANAKSLHKEEEKMPFSDHDRSSRHK